MNIYKGKYGIVKNELYAFGRKIGMDNAIIYTQKYWEKKFLSLHEEKSWDYVITAYLAFWCSEEERHYIDLMFLKRKNVILISSKLNLSEKTIYNWRGQILTDLIGLAMQNGLIKTDIAGKETYRSKIVIIEISEIQIAEVIKILGYKVGGTTKLKRVLQAIIWIEQNGSAWKDLPSVFGSWRVVYNIYNRWSRNGKLERIKNVIIR